MTHTKTPWQIAKMGSGSYIRGEDGTLIVSCFCKDGKGDLPCTSNAAHIVKCVNLFDELVETVFNGTEVLTLEDHIQWRNEALALLSKTKSPAYNRALSDVARMDKESGGEA